MKKNKGFTLVEIMVVIVILGLLAGIVAPNVMGSLDTANTQKVVFDITTFENALKMYRADNSVYPTTEQGLQALIEKPTAKPVPRRYKNGGYIEKLPKDPWGLDYFYKRPSDHGKRYDVYSSGPDGEPGTCDDIGNWNMDDPPTEDTCNQ